MKVSISDLLTVLRSDRCSCEGPKKVTNPLCPECYRDLPPELRLPLYARRLRDKAEAYGSALTWLAEHKAGVPYENLWNKVRT